MKNTVKTTLFNIWIYILFFIKWLCFSILTGIVCGTVGGLFVKSINFVTSLRSSNGWLILLLPLGGIISVAIYKLLRVSNIGTNDVFEAVMGERKISLLLAPAIFIGTCLTHLFGGSAGKEGAALQLGGSISSFFGRLIKLDTSSRHIMTICGMSALFSAVFGTPIGASVFAIEVISVGSFCSAAIFPSVLSSVTASFVAGFLKLKPENFKIDSEINIDIKTFLSVVLIAICGALVSMLFCFALRYGERFTSKFLKNEYLRVAVGGTIIILLTFVVGSSDYNGGGVHFIEEIFKGHNVKNEAFILKLIFTVITVSSGFKGGEIVPTLFIGATLGGALSSVLNIDAPFGAAVGMSALFCGVTNCPIATIFLSIELFGIKGLVFFAISTGVSFLLSGNTSLYEGQKLSFSKLEDKHLNV